MDSTYLCPPSYFKYSNMEVLLILLDMDRNISKPVVPPSKYRTEMSLTTDERLEKLKSINRKEKIRPEKTLNMLKAIPDIVIFQNYNLGDTMTVPVNILNTYEISRSVRVTLPPSTVFTITYPYATVATKIAPGMSYQMNVNFKVQDRKDYRHFIRVESEDEAFYIPIITISDRPLLDIPDKITLPITPVKTISERTLIVRNLGEIVGIYTIQCSPGFTANPIRGCVDPHKYIQLTLQFKSDFVGEHHGRMTIIYESGEVLTVALDVTTYESDVFLETNKLSALETFLNLQRKAIVKLYNRSNHIVRFSWMLYRDKETSKREMLKYKHGFNMVRELESCRFADMVQEGVIGGGDTHETIYKRIYQDELREADEKDHLVFTNTNWSVYPMEGEVWPNNDTRFTVTFRPTEAAHYESTMYLEVSGKENRLPLRLSGIGKGPDMQLNIEELNANDIFLCSKHQYEVCVFNKGHIPGNIAFNPKPLAFGGMVSCEPLSNYVQPLRYAQFVLEFFSNVQGNFVEDIEFVIQESQEIRKILFSGNIVCPLLNFDVVEVNFGNVTLGYPVSTHISLINTTQVPIEYVTKFTGDGTIPAISCTDFAKLIKKPYILAPQEMSFHPNSCIVSPNSAMKGELTLLPNVCGEIYKRLTIIMWDTPKYSISLPIHYVCQIPDIVCETQDIFMRGCFVNYVYTRTITIRNRNGHPGYFMFVLYEIDGMHDIVFEPKIPEDYIDAFETKEMDLDIYTKYIGHSTLKVYITIFGGTEKLYLCTIRCNGQGPVITVPEHLYFDDVRTLRVTSQYIKIVNDSPVPAVVRVTQMKKSWLSITENCLSLNPSENLDLEVRAYMRTPGNFSDKVIFTTEEGETQMCFVKATAIGSSILCEPDLEPEINLGTLLTHHMFSLTVKFTNMCRKHHKIIWTRTKKLKSFRDDPSTYSRSIFSLKPNTFELAPGQSIDCILSGCGSKIGLVEEDFYCQAMIDNKRDYGVITSFIVLAEFVCPMLELSHRNLKFRIDTGIDNTAAFLEDTVTVKNISKLAITTNISVEDPFYIILESIRTNSIEKHMENGDTLVFNVEFVPKSKDKECVVWHGDLAFSYQEHPHKHKIPVTGEENFPSLKIEPAFVDFECVPNFFSSSMELIVKNVSPLPVSFVWEWIREDLLIAELQSVPINWPTLSPEKIPSLSTISTPPLASAIKIEDYQTATELNREGQIVEKRLELEVPPPTMMTAQLTDSPPVEKATLERVELVPQYLDEMRIMLYQLVHYYDTDQIEVEALKCLPDPDEYESRMCCHDIFDLIPTYGCLGPYEAQMVSLEFNPCPNTSVEAIVHCHLSGGRTETLSVAGKSSNLSFSIESDVIEFGRQLFCEFCEQKILIKNTGFAPLDIEPIHEGMSAQEPVDTLPKPNWFNVSLVRVNSDYEVVVKFFPGLTREFSQKFCLQIAYLEPYSLTIHGYGVLAQIFCAVPRPSLDDELVNYLSYNAIASLTPEFLDDVKLLTQLTMKFKDDIPYNIREILKEDEWGIMSYNEEYPSIADIQMAVERTVVDLYVSKNDDILFEHTLEKTSSVISNKLIAPPYLIDFKYVVRDTQVCYTVSILNYGPAATSMRSAWQKKTASKLGLKAKFSRTHIEVGITSELYVSFHPTIKMFPEGNNAINETLYIMVPHGQKVPIEIKACVTLPRVKPSSKCIHFEHVSLGSCLKKNILLQNTGFVPCNWKVRIEMEKQNPYKPVFSSKTSEGTLNVGEQTLLDVYFEPMANGKALACLTIAIEQNPEEIEVNLRGYGETPHLVISEMALHFPSTLPYAEQVEMVFTIENTNKCPIEFIFSDFDRNVDREEQMTNFLLEYYKKTRLYVPQRKPGDGMCNQIVNFYNGILKAIRQRLRTESAAGDSGSTTTDTESRSGAKHSSFCSVAIRRTTITNYEDQEPLLSKTPEEIQALLKEQIRIMKDDLLAVNAMETMPDPIRDAIEDATRRPFFSTTYAAKSGILIIFHGAPQTDYVQAANRAGLIMKLPVVSVDKLLCDALVRPLSLAAMKVRQILDDSFFAVASETDLINYPDYDEYDQLQRKINVLLSGKKKKKPSKKQTSKDSKRSKKGKKGTKNSVTSKRSSKSDSSKDKNEKKGKKIKKADSSMYSVSSKSSGKLKVDKRPTLMGISEELIFEILQLQLLSYKTGLIVESLDSTFIRRPMMILNWILKVTGNIRYIHCILLSYTYQDYLLQKESAKIIDVGNVLEERKNKVEEIMHMDAESYANISAESKLVFKEDVLIPRKLNLEKRRLELKQRLLDKYRARDQRKKSRKKSFEQPRGSSKLEDLGKIDKEKKKKGKKTKSSSKSSKSNQSKKSKTISGKKSKNAKGSKGSKGGKGSKASKDSKGSKGSQKTKQKEKLSTAEMEVKKALLNSENTIWEIMYILEHWDRRHGLLLKPIPSQAFNQILRKTKSTKSSGASSKKSTDNKLLPVSGPTCDVVLKIRSPEEMERLAHTGIPCWVIENACKSRESTVMESLSLYLRHTPELLEAQLDLKNSLVPKLEETNMTFNVLQKRKKRERVHTDIFGLWDVDVMCQRDWCKSSFFSDNETISPRGGSTRNKRPVRRTKPKLSVVSLDRSSISTRPSITRSYTKLKEGISEVNRNLTTRAVILPGQKYTYKATFAPKKVGDYHHDYGIELVGAPTKYDIKCHGKCELPSFNMHPDVMFEKIAESREKTAKYENCFYILNDKQFDFGIMLLPQLKTNETRFLTKSTKVIFANDLSQTCEIQLVLIEDRYSTNVFTVKPENCVLAPGDREEITISSSPKQLGKFAADVIVLTKDNPEVYTLHLVAAAIDVSVCFVPASVQFEKSTLDNVVKKTVKLRNLSPVLIKWKAVDIEELQRHFKVYPCAGVILPHSKHKIEFEFLPDVVEDVPAKDFNVVIYDAEHEFYEPLCKETISVSAEVIEVDIDCPKELHFGEVKGHVKHVLQFPVLSKIKYNMEILFTDINTVDKSSEQRAIAQLFNIHPRYMTLKCGKVSNAEVTFFPRSPVDFDKMPIFKCIVSDPSSNNIIMSFDVTATATTHFAKYELCPMNEIDFGHQLVYTEKTEWISLHNKGKFEFSYVVASLSKIQQKKRKKRHKKGIKGKKSKKDQKVKKSKSSTSKSKSESKKTKSDTKSSKTKDTKSTKSSKKKDAKKMKKESKKTMFKVKQTKLEVGCFTIISSTGTLQPGESLPIKVTSKPKTMKSIRETILFFIPESESPHKRGMPIVLSTRGIVPSFNFNSFQEIFCQQYVVNSLADFNCPEQINSNLIFVTEDMTLYFNKVCINTTAEARIRVQNTSVVTTTLYAALSEGSVFSIYPNESVVNAFSHVNFTIKFEPVSIQTYLSVLKIFFGCIIKTKNELIINISGDGYVPEITIREPEIDPTDNTYYLVFTPLVIGQSETKTIVIENTGVIPCKVIAEITYDTSDVMSFAYEQTDVYKHDEKDKGVTNTLSSVVDTLPALHTTLVQIEPGSRISLHIHFRPSFELSDTVNIVLQIVNNPFELYTIHARIESFLEDIIIEGLPIAWLKQTRGWPNLTTVSRYELDFGFCTINSFKNIRFTIRNTSGTYIYRFQFTNYDRLTFSPCAGHLKPGASKNILATFLPTSSIILNKEVMNCTICKIQYVYDDNELVSWDDRQNVVVWKTVSEVALVEKKSVSAPSSSRRLLKESSKMLKKASGEDAASLIKPNRSTVKAMSSKKSTASIGFSTADVRKIACEPSSVVSIKEKKIELKAEPEWTQLQDNLRCIELLTSMTADYCSYVCSTREIVLEDTLMFERRSSTFTVANASSMPLKLNWIITMNECFPRRINSVINTPEEIEELKSQSSHILANIVRQRVSKSARQRPTHLTGSERFISGDCSSTGGRPVSSIFSSENSLRSKTRDSWHEAEYLPFSIDPCDITIPAYESVDFTVTFAPIDVFQYMVHLCAHIENLQPQDPGLEVAIHAKSLLPLYHFDIDPIIPSDYLSKRQSKICGEETDANTKIVTFDAIGLNMVHTRTFNVINPTGESFKFRWDPAPTNSTGKDVSLFHCNTPEGSVTKGKMAESSFSFVPDKHGNYEALYIFTIEKYNLKTNFLLSATARNPCVFFSSSHVTLKPTLINIEVTETITLNNNENVEFVFVFKKSSLLNKDHSRKISIEPMVGTLKQKSQIPIRLTFKASQTGEVDFRLKCEVENMHKPLILTVLASVYDVEPSISYLALNNKIVLDCKNVNTFEIKSLILFEEDKSTFLITNHGKIGFYYKWQLVEKFGEEYADIVFHDEEGYCQSATETSTIVTIKPLKHLWQRRFKILLQISYGPRYVIHLMCTTPRDAYKFSFEDYDFGECLVQTDKTNYYKCFLEFTNLDRKPLTLEYDAAMIPHFSIIFKAKETLPKTTEKIPICFHPMAVGSYKITLNFMVNSTAHPIVIRGGAGPLVLQLVNQEDKFLNLGALLAGKQVTKTVHVVNKSKASICAFFDLYDRLPFHTRPKRILEAEFEKEDIAKMPVKKKSKKTKKEKKHKKSKKSRSSSRSSKSKKSSKDSKRRQRSHSKSTGSSRKSRSSKSSKKSVSPGGKKRPRKKHKSHSAEKKHAETAEDREERLIKEFVKVSPNQFIRIPPDGTSSITITFSPNMKMAPLTRKIFYQVQDQVEALCLIKGSCIAADYYLDREKIAFGSVVKGCTNEEKFTLFNTGDIGGKYKWKFEKQDSCISIEPMKGYISPDMSITFIAKYQPNTILCLTTARAKCTIDYYKQPLRIELTGSCVRKPPPQGTIKFACHVRTRATDSVTLQNKTSEPWMLKPKILGEHFTSTETIYVAPQSSATCDLSYSPTVMSSSEHPHKATLIFNLPDGHCILYNLEGTANKPLPVGKIHRNLTCKTQYTETLEVANWLKTPQQFKVITINLKPHESKNILYKFTGNAVVNVPAARKRQYKWGIFVLNVGTLYFQVLFKNETTQEFLYYDITLHVSLGGPLEEISLSTCVRMPCTYKLKLENPIKTPVVFHVSSTCQMLSFEKTNIVEPCSEKIININYLPLLPGIADVNLDVLTKELGVFLYHFHLEAGSPVPERPIIFKCALGQSVKRKISVHNECANKSEFKLKLEDRSIFSTCDVINVPPKEDSVIELSFEPQVIGNVHSTLTLDSVTAGQYIYPLIGTCIYPTPLGPFYIKPGGSSTIVFKNPFDEEKTFKFKTDCDVFSVRPTSETLQSKQTVKVAVHMMNIKTETLDDKPIPATGKLTVTFDDCVIPNLKWTYYLQADLRKINGSHS